MRVLAGVMLIVAAAVAVFVLPSSADDAPGCEGLEAYRAAMFDAADPLPMEIDDNPLTMSSSDWLAFAESSLAFHDRMAAIEPPEWAAAWHDARLDAFGFREQLGRMAAQSGMLVVLGFTDTIDELNERYESTNAEAIAACPDFARFSQEWAALAATPVATPVR